MKKSSSTHNALQTAMRLLAMREHTAFELKKKLRLKGYALAEVETVLAYCQQHDLQNDQRAAESLCRTRIAQGYGPFKIEQDMKQKGVSVPVSQRVLAEIAVNWCEQAKTILAKNAWRFSEPEDLAKRHRFLLGRGFSFDVIQVVLGKKNAYENSGY